MLLKALLICLSGFLLSLSAPGYDLWFLAWIGLVPLFIVTNISKKIRGAVFYSFLFGFCYNLTYLYWFKSMNSIKLIGLNYFEDSSIPFLLLFILVFYYSLFFPVFTLCAIYIRKLPFKFLYYVLVSFLWLLVFNKLFAKEPILAGFPWTLIEYSQYKNLYLIQIVEYFGSISISFLIVFFNLVLSDFIIWLFRNKFSLNNNVQFKTIVLNFIFIVILISFSIFHGISLYKKNEEQFSEDKSKQVCILQGNLPKVVTKERFLDINLARETFTKLSESYNSSLYIIPEGGLPSIHTHDTITQNWLQTIATLKKSDFIAGTFCLKEDKRQTNCAVAYSPKLNKNSQYEKEKLVPISEYIPFYSLVCKLCKKCCDKDFPFDEGFAIGKQTTPIETSLGKVGTCICFEMIFPEIIKKQTLKGANLLVNVSSLKRFTDDMVKKQYLGFAVFRAIENRKPFILAVNNGISAFVTSNGKIKSQSLPEAQQALLDWVNPNNKVTVYAKYGW